jgi:hypothetical protein
MKIPPPPNFQSLPLVKYDPASDISRQIPKSPPGLAHTGAKDALEIMTFGNGHGGAIRAALSRHLETNPDSFHAMPLTFQVIGTNNVAPALNTEHAEILDQLARRGHVVHHSNDAVATWQEEGKTHALIKTSRGELKEVTADFAFKEANGKIIVHGGVAYDPATQRADGNGNVYIVGALTYGPDVPPSGGTAPKLTESAERAVVSMIAAHGDVSAKRLAVPNLQRDEMIDLSNQQLKMLEKLLAGEELKKNGEINQSTMRLLLPNRLEGEPIFSLADVKQFAVFTGTSRPEAGKEIGARDDHIVSTLLPGKKGTPLCYFSELKEDKKGNAFWHNIVLWDHLVMEPTTPGVKNRQRWTPPIHANHPNTVNFALYGKDGEEPAFTEVHFMNGRVDAKKAEFDVEEHRLSMTPHGNENGERTVARLQNPGFTDPSKKRWVTQSHQVLKSNGLKME